MISEVKLTKQNFSVEIIQESFSTVADTVINGNLKPSYQRDILGSNKLALSKISLKKKTHKTNKPQVMG